MCALNINKDPEKLPLLFNSNNNNSNQKFESLSTTKPLLRCLEDESMPNLNLFNKKLSYCEKRRRRKGLKKVIFFLAI